MRRSAALSYRYSGVDSPRGTPGGAASNSASYLSRCQTCSRYVSTSPGPPFDGGGPSVRKNFGSLIGDMYRPGCRDSAACSAVVPALGTPATRKSGSAMFPLVLTPRVRAGGQIDNISDDINRDSPGRSNPYPAARPVRIPHRPDPVRAALMACADSASNGRSGSSPARPPPVGDPAIAARPRAAVRARLVQRARQPAHRAQQLRDCGRVQPGQYRVHLREQAGDGAEQPGELGGRSRAVAHAVAGTGRTCRGCGRRIRPGPPRRGRGGCPGTCSRCPAPGRRTRSGSPGAATAAAAARRSRPRCRRYPRRRTRRRS